jgi:hypothetical protein
MRRAFAMYQYIGPVVLTPLAAWLWWRHYDGNVALAAIAVLVPIAHAYIVPGFGSATAMLMLAAIGTPAAHPSMADVASAGLLAAVLLGAVNAIYDALAIRSGMLKVYNQPWADGRGEWAIAVDYAPWFFGGFGLIHGAGLKYAEGLLLTQPDAFRALTIGLALLAATVTLPTLGYVLQSYLLHGHHGCRPVVRAGE